MTGITSSLPSLSGMEAEDAKTTLRAALRERRQERSLRRRTDAGEALAVVGSRLVTSLNARCVALYASRPSEPDTQPLLEELAASGIEILLPVLGDGLQRQWAQFTSIDDLVERAPGRPPEPSGPYFDMSHISRADLVLAPALAVDTRGCRLGQGGGWYDRALGHISSDTKVVAVVFDDEVFSTDELALPVEDHDKFVAGALTPHGIQWF